MYTALVLRGLMLHTFKIMFLSYKQAYRESQVYMLSLRREVHTKIDFFYRLLSPISFEFLFSFGLSVKQKVLGRMSNLGNGKGTKKYHKSSPCNPCAISSLLKPHRVCATPLCSSAQIENTFKAPFINIYIVVKSSLEYMYSFIKYYFTFYFKI